MKKTSRFLLAACILLALALTFSCTSDDPDNSGGSGSNLSVLPKQVQVYFVETDYELDYDGKIVREIVRKEEYKGNGDVFAYIYTDDDGEKADTLWTSKIEGGLLSSNFPESINSKYLNHKFNCDYYENASWLKSCESNVVAPATLLWGGGIFFKAAFSDGKRCEEIYLYPIKPGEKIVSHAAFLYASESGKVTGTMTKYTNYDYIGIENFNLNLSKGGNIMFRRDRDNITDITTDIPSGVTWEWWCE